MADVFMENIREMGPAFAVSWIVTLICIVIRPQKYFNSILLLFSLMISLLFVSGFLGDQGAIFVFIVSLLVLITIFMVPAFLIVNGIQMIRKESFSLAHVLSLVLGIGIAIGEIATINYLLGYTGVLDFDKSQFLNIFISMSVFYFSFLILSFVIYSVFIQLIPHIMNFDYIIIHGCGLREGQYLTNILKARTDRAIEIFRKCKEKPIIIPSGGKGTDEKISEAQAMKNYLLENGIPEDKIILEDKSATTRENLINSRNIIEERPGSKKTALISSNYHVYRCLRIARKIGFKCIGIGAPVAFYYWPSALIREFIAVFTEKGFMIQSLIAYFIFICPLLFSYFR